MISTLIRNESISLGTPPPGNNEYLVDTENNRVIYPYTKVENIIGLDGKLDEVKPTPPISDNDDNTSSGGSILIDPNNYIEQTISLAGRTFSASKNNPLIDIKLETSGIWTIWFSILCPNTLGYNGTCCSFIGINFNSHWHYINYLHNTSNYLRVVSSYLCKTSAEETADNTMHFILYPNGASFTAPSDSVLNYRLLKLCDI